jgi:hypothetical protein
MVIVYLSAPHPSSLKLPPADFRQLADGTFTFKSTKHH